jgi:hypothetical protein
MSALAPEQRLQTKLPAQNFPACLPPYQAGRPPAPPAAEEAPAGKLLADTLKGTAIAGALLGGLAGLTFHALGGRSSAIVWDVVLGTMAGLVGMAALVGLPVGLLLAAEALLVRRPARSPRAPAASPDTGPFSVADRPILVPRSESSLLSGGLLALLLGGLGGGAVLCTSALVAPSRHAAPPSHEYTNCHPSRMSVLPESDYSPPAVCEPDRYARRGGADRLGSDEDEPDPEGTDR